MSYQIQQLSSTLWTINSFNDQHVEWTLSIGQSFRIKPIQGWEYPDTNRTWLNGFDLSNRSITSCFSISHVCSILWMLSAFNNQRVEYNQSKVGSIQTPIRHDWKDFICQMDQPCHLSWYHRSILLDNLNVCMKEDILVCISIWLVRLVCLQSAFWILYRRWNSYKKVPKFWTDLFGYS